MIFAFLDEFGHNGPYFSKDHAQYNTSPVFGLAGYLMPESNIRNFASCFLKRKQELLSIEIEKSGKHAYEWEKKGTNLFTAASITKYPAVRASMFRLINEIRNRDGKLFYYGREKIRSRDDMNSTGLYKTIFSKAIRQINSYCDSIGETFIIIIDENSARKYLLETAAKTMFGTDPARRMLSPPFQVESYLNQNIQAADWFATIVGRLWNYHLDSDGFEKYKEYDKYFWQRIHAICTHSTVMRRSQRALRPRYIGDIGRAFLRAQTLEIEA